MDECQTIYKYPIRLHGMSLLALPKDAKLLNVSFVGQDTVVYALINPREKEKELWRIQGFQTGEPIPQTALLPLSIYKDNLKYLSTIVYNGGLYVEHYFYTKCDVPYEYVGEYYSDGDEVAVDINVEKQAVM